MLALPTSHSWISKDSRALCVCENLPLLVYGYLTSLLSQFELIILISNQVLIIQILPRFACRNFL